MDRAGVTLFSKERLHIRSLLQCGIGILRNIYKQGYFIRLREIFIVSALGSIAHILFTTTHACQYPTFKFFQCILYYAQTQLFWIVIISLFVTVTVFIRFLFLHVFYRGFFKDFLKHFSSSDLRTGRPVSSYTVVYTTHYQR